MAEYAGYSSPGQQVDWESLSSGLAEKLSGIGVSREKQKAELDQIATDNINKMNQIEQGQNQTFGTMILDFQNEGRNMANAWNKELKAGRMSPSEYKKRMSNLMDYTNILAGSAKTMDARISEAMKRQEEGIASNYELEMLKNFGSLAEIKNAKFHVSDNGSILYSKVDPTTGAVVGDMQDIRTPNLPQNIVDNKVVVPDAVDGLIKNWDPYATFKDLGRGSELTISDVRGHKEWDGMKAKVAMALTSSPRATLSVLADNGVIEPIYYRTEEEKNQVRNERIEYLKELNRVTGKSGDLTSEQLKEIDLSLVKNAVDENGLFQPVLTEEQIKLARERVMSEVEMQTERKVQGSAKQQWSSGDGSSSGSGDGDERNQLMAGYKASLKAFGIDPNTVNRNNIDDYKSWGKVDVDFGGLKGGFKYKKVGSTIQVWSPRPNPETPGKLLFTAHNPKQLAQYIYGGEDVTKSEGKWEKARQFWLNRDGNQSAPSGNNNDPLGLGIESGN